MHQPVQAFRHRNKESKLGNILDFALHLRTNRMIAQPGLPWILGHTLQTQTDTPRLGINLEHRYIHHIAFRQHLRRLNVALGPAQFRTMDHAFNTGFQLNHRSEIQQTTNRPGEAHARLISHGNLFPRIGLQYLHRYRYLAGFGIELGDLNRHTLTNTQHLGGVRQATPGNIRYMQ